MRSSQRGFSLVDMVVVSGITMITVGVAAPTITSAMRSYTLNASVQSVATAVRNTRYQAVTQNRTMRVLFNCPAANQMRVVEVTGNAAVDNAADRCSTTAYPYPDPDPAVLPNADGPVLIMSRESEFGAQPDLQISPMGRITPLVGCPAACVTSAPPATLVVRDSHEQRTVTVAASGQVSVSTSGYARDEN